MMSQHDTGGGVWNLFFPNERQLGTNGGSGGVDVLPPPLTRLGGGFQEPGKMLGGVTVVPHSPPTTVFGGGSQGGGEGGNGVDNDDGHAFDNEGGDGDLAQGRDVPPLLRTARPRITIGNSEVLPAAGMAPSEGIKSNPDTTSGRGSGLDGARGSDDDGMNEGSRDSNKVASSSIGGGGFFNEGSRDSNKVVSSSICGSGIINEGSDGLHKVEELEGGSTFSSAHAMVKCMRKYRIKVKGAACRGSACCGGTT